MKRSVKKMFRKKKVTKEWSRLVRGTLIARNNRIQIRKCIKIELHVNLLFLLCVWRFRNMKRKMKKMKIDHFFLQTPITEGGRGDDGV